MNRPFTHIALGLCTVLILSAGAMVPAMAGPGGSAGHGGAAGHGAGPGAGGSAGAHGGAAGGTGGPGGRDGGPIGVADAGGRGGGAAVTSTSASSVIGAIGRVISGQRPDKKAGNSRIQRKAHLGRPHRSSRKAVMPFKKIERLARKGNLYAKWRLARLHERSTVFPHNKIKAYKLYNEIFKAYRSADLYSSRTKFIQETLISVAGYYQTGLPGAGVKKNPARAYSILKHVALYGHPRAQYMLGQMKLRGEGTKPSRKQGMRWLNLAAQKKHAAAQAELGRLYTSKKIPKTDRAKGLMWLGLARGNEQDTKTRKTVSDLYDSLLIKANREERDRAETLTMGWQQRYGSE